MKASNSLQRSLSGTFLCGLGIFVLMGWIIGSESMVRPVPSSPAMSINTALMLVLSGASLLTATGAHWGKSIFYPCVAVLILLPIAILSQHIFDVDLGIDLARVHEALGDGHAKPGRTAPNASLAFLFGGLVFVLQSSRNQGRTSRRLSVVLSALTIAIGSMALLGYILNLEAMYRVASYNKMATLTAVGVFTLGVGLWSFVASNKPGIKESVHDKAHQVTGLAATLLTLFAITAGLTGFAILRHSFEQSAADTLDSKARTFAFTISTALEHVQLLSASLANRPPVKRALRDLQSASGTPEVPDQLQNLAQNSIDLGFTGIQIYTATNDLIVTKGSLIGVNADMMVKLNPRRLTDLLWKDGLIFRQEHAVIENGNLLGRIILERKLSGVTALLNEARQVDHSSDIVLCGRTGEEVSCFPSRFYDRESRLPMFKQDGSPFLPISKALLGEAGSSNAKDLRGIAVLAGYAPLPEHGLGIVVKIDLSEVYVPLRDRLNLLVFTLLAFVTIGTLLLRKWVRPLVQQIVAEQQRIKAILDNSHDAFIAIGSNGLITDWNAQAEKTLGWTAGEAIGRNLDELIVPSVQREGRKVEFSRFLTGVKGPVVNRHVEDVAIHRDGHEIPVELAVAAFHDGKGYAASAFLRDLTDRKAAERKAAEHTSELEAARMALIQSQKLEAVGKLTGGVAHDFNNVLQVIEGSLQLLQIENQNNLKIEKRVGTASAAVARGAKLAAQLLAFARKQPLQPKPTNLARLVNGMGEMLQRALGGTIEIETVVAAGLWNTLVDRNQMENVILNLAINARDAMRGDGKLTIEVGNATLDNEYVQHEPELKAGQYVMLAVSDTGAGMVPEVRDRVFEPFFTTKPEGEGTGLGLSMAYGFVKQSDGHIRIYSESGHGTTVKIYLPRSFAADARDSAPGAEAIHGGSETILVVEDDLAVQATVVDMLSGLGYQVLKADDAEMALQMIQQLAKLDLLFTDVVMPGSLRSPELAKKARMFFPDIKVLFTSGYTQNAIVHGGRLDPGVHLLSKPYGRDQLSRKVRQVLAETDNTAQKI